MRVLDGKHVLIADDDLSVRVLMEAIFKRHGATTALASDGREAIAKLSTRPDLIVLDLFMPNVTGFAVVEHLRTHAPDLLSRTIIFTAAPPESARTVHDLLVLYKPFDADRLSAAIESSLSGVPLPSAPPEHQPQRRRIGFAMLSPEARREIARRGGRAAHAAGRAHHFTSATARIAGRRGGEAVSRDREHMARIARRGNAPISQHSTTPADATRLLARPRPTTRLDELPPRTDAQVRLHNLKSVMFGLSGYIDLLAELPQAISAAIHTAARDPDSAHAAADAIARREAVTTTPYAELAALLAFVDVAQQSMAAARRILNPGAAQTVDVHETIRQAVLATERLFSGRGGTVEHRLEAAPREVSADPGMLVAVWANLLENALNAGARHATIETLDSPAGTCISVRDDGSGIPPALLARLFEGISTKPGGGTGLRYVRDVITSINGTITVSSQPGETVFTITVAATIEARSS